MIIVPIYNVMKYNWKFSREKVFNDYNFPTFANKFSRYKLSSQNILSIILLFEVFIFEDRSKSTKTSKFLSLKNFQLCAKVWSLYSRDLTHV